MSNILIIEDDQLLCQALKGTFEKAGFTIFIAANGSDALEFLQDHQIDLVFLDIVLPGINGYEVLAKLKANDSKHKDIPVVILSNLGQTNEIDRAIDLGAKDYVIKTDIDLNKLIEQTKEKYLKL